VRLLPTVVQLFFFWLLAVPASPQGNARPVQRGQTRSPHGALAIACENCHTFTSWKPIRSVPEFDHDKTRYPLRGLHEKVQCRQCHASLVFTKVGTACADCHADIHRRQMGANCEQCHSVKGWEVGLRTVREHQNRFPLLGAHAATECSACHTGAAVGQFTGLRTECVACHFGDYQNAKSFDHKAAGLPTTCQNCHSVDSWFGAKFDHAATGFALEGAHARIECSACHVSGRYQGTSAACYSCHARDYTATQNPSHTAARFPTECSQCHTTASWRSARFDHNTFTQFALTGAHVNATCQQCHANGRFTGTRKDCASCHLADFNRTTNPNHVNSGFPTTCANCHNTVSWSGAKFDHALTQFPLTGAHINATCQQCHANGPFTGTPKDCASCHLADFNRTTNPNHSAAGFPTTCAMCHTTAAWSGARFDHSKTQFPLTGAHVNATCQQCHVNRRYTGTPKDCASCHLADFNRTTSPNHVNSGFPTTCATCHSTTSWSGAKFDHDTLTKFPLTGAHVNATCQQCHVNGRYTGTPKDCTSCHLADYNRTTNPNHTAAGFPQDCSICHSTSQWAGAKFDHSRTKFPLTGAHTTATCASCHVGGKFTGLTTACVSCHLTNFNNTRNPNHIAAGFPQECAVCHTTVAWVPSSFNHAQTRFPLTGAHVRVQCASCHIGGKYAGTPLDCYSCHKQDYSTTTNPNNAAAGFSTTCTTCHTTTTWTGARVTHKFPIYSGAHAGKWTTCADCHTNPSNYAVFSCLNCHAHEKTRMDEKHRNRPNYVYNSVNCYSCHPTGRKG